MNIDIKCKKNEEISYKKLLTVSEVAEYLAVARQTIYNMVSERKIPFIKLGKAVRFDMKDVNALIEKGKVEAVNEWKTS